MDHDRLIRIIETYGADERRWPEDERDLALALLARDQDAQRIRNAESLLDRELESSSPPTPLHLRSQILSALPPQQTWLDRVIDWLLPSPAQLHQVFWRPVLAASLPLVIGLMLGGSLTGTEPPDWSADDELYLVQLDTTQLGILDE